MILIYDIETTGLPLWHEPSDDPGQPHIVQIAAVLTNDDGKNLAALDVVIQPDGWTVPDEVVEIHGITTEKAAEIGVPLNQALDVFLSLWRRAARRVCFNETFDARMVRIALCRVHGKDHAVSGEWKAGAAECVMRLARPICKLPKAPKLVEAYEIIVGEPMKDAHSAMGDVIATGTLYFKLRG